MNQNELSVEVMKNRQFFEDLEKLRDHVEKRGFLKQEEYPKFEDYVKRKGLDKEVSRETVFKMLETFNNEKSVAIVSQEALSAIISGGNANDVADNMVKIQTATQEFSLKNVLILKSMVEGFQQEQSLNKDRNVDLKDTLEERNNFTMK